MPRFFLRSCRQKAVLLALGFILSAPAGQAQNADLNYNTYYRYPVSIGVEYQSLSPFANYGVDQALGRWLLH